MAYNHLKGLTHYVPSKRICFIPVPKNGSSSFRRSCERLNLRNESIDFLINKQIIKNCNVYAVYNPDVISRFISGFLELITRKEIDPYGYVFKLEKFIYIEDKLKFIIYLLENNHFYDAHIQKQKYYLTNENSNPLSYKINYLNIDNYSVFLNDKFNFSLLENKKDISLKKDIFNILDKLDFLYKIQDLYSEDIDFINNLTNL